MFGTLQLPYTHTQNLLGNHGSIRNRFYIVTWEKLDQSPFNSFEVLNLDQICMWLFTYDFLWT